MGAIAGSLSVHNHASGTYTRGVTLWGFAPLVESFGGNPHDLLLEAGLPLDAVDQPDTLISFVAYAHLLEIAAKKLDQSSFGLEWTLALPPHFPNLGALALSAHLATNFGEWIQTALRYWQFHTNGFTAELIDDGKSNDVRLRSTITPDILFPIRQFAEHALGNQVRICRYVTEYAHENPTVVRFQHFKPKDTSLHEKIFGCPVEFDAPHNEVVFARRFLDFKADGSFSVLRPLVNFYVKHRINQLQVHDLRVSTSVGQAVASVLGTGNCKIEYIAQSLELDPKKLQRLLSAEGTTFSEILDTTRMSLAKRYLRDSRAPVARIAGLLDYSSLPPFTLAFKRWTGVSPLAFRKTGRATGENDLVSTMMQAATAP